MGVLSRVVPSECFGIGTMLIQYLCYEYGLSLLLGIGVVLDGR